MIYCTPKGGRIIDNRQIDNLQIELANLLKITGYQFGGCRFVGNVSGYQSICNPPTLQNRAATMALSGFRFRLLLLSRKILTCT